MNKLIYLILLGVLLSTISAQSKISKLHSKQKLDCSACHTCETPTKLNPCLALCPRENIKTVTYRISDAPAIIEINQIRGEKDLYAPSMFSHKAHAEMAEMSGGCETCHHYNPPGEIVKCSTCHETNRSKSDINMPDLKSAFHRQCIDCHTEWEKESQCESCHTLNDDYKSAIAKTEIAKVHKPIERPVTLVYKTKEHKKGILATFHHNDHVSLFGLECANCHQDESCQSCHNQKPNFTKTVDGKDHNKCASCHDTESKNQCAKCHSNKETKPFNHFVNTDFDLNKYHSKNRCQSCHKIEGKYSGLSPNCQNCHDWNEDNFNHTITGLQLSEDHIDNDCSDCHVDNNYSNPTCSDCHEEDEGFTVPNKLPGEKVK